MAAYEEIYAGMGDKAARTADRFIELIKALVEDKKGTRTFHEMSDNGLKTILRHVKKGGDVRMQDVPSEYAPVFEAILKSQGIPYIAMDSGKGEDRHRIYITRDKDNGALEDVWRQFRMEMNVGMNELSVSQFIKENQGQDIRRSKGYDLVETEVFRRKIAEHGGAFAVTESDEERGKYDVMYLPRDQEEVDHALRDMQYELSGDPGREYRDTLEKDIRGRIRFEQNLNPKRGETLYIVDSENPNNFISVTATGFAVHSLKLSQETLKSGKKQEIVTDPDVVLSNLFDRERIMNYAEGLKKPVILTEKEMPIVKGIAPDGSAIIAKQDDFRAFFRKFREQLSLREDAYDGLSMRVTEKIGKTYTLSHIPGAKMAELYEAFSEAGLSGRTAVVGDSIAYTEKDRKQINRILDSVLYSDMTELEKTENRLYYEGCGNIELENPASVRYLVSARDPQFVIRIKPEGMDILRNGALEREIPRGDEQYGTLLMRMIDSMKEPVVMTEEEIAASKEEKTEIINSRRRINQKTEALDYLEDVDNSKKTEIHGILNQSEARHLDARQQEAVRRHLSHETTDTYVDRTFMEKIMDKDLSKKLRQENHVTESKDRTVER